MNGEFITPNWHVLFLHFPIALLITGLLGELTSFVWRREGLRAAGRWMILGGALLSIPTAFAGMYAFRDALEPGSATVALTQWQQVVQQSSWSDEQWEFMDSHIWLNASAAILFVLSAFVWVVCSARWRRRLYWPLLLLVAAGVGLMVVGGWYGGEGVYRYGTAVEATSAGGHADHEHGGGNHGNHNEHEAHGHGHGDNHNHGAGRQHQDGGAAQAAGLKFYLPPLQLHIVMAGIVLMSVLGTVMLWTEQRRAVPTTGAGEPVPARARILGFRYWLLTFLLAAITGVAAIWSVAGTFTADALRANLELLGAADHLRLLIHAILGVTILAFPLVIAFLTRSRLRPRWAGAGSIVLLLVLVAQLWLGILMLYDGHSGPLTGFSAPAAAGEGNDHHHEH